MIVYLESGAVRVSLRCAVIAADHLRSGFGSLDDEALHACAGNADHKPPVKIEAMRDCRAVTAASKGYAAFGMTEFIISYSACRTDWYEPNGCRSLGNIVRKIKCVLAGRACERTRVRFVDQRN